MSMKEVSRQITELSAQFRNLETKVDGIATQVGEVDTRVGGLESKFETLEKKVAGLDKKLDDGFNAVKARDELMRALVGADAEAFEAQIVENGFGEDSGKSGRPG